jgi:predicted GNAT family acetyltransferase
MSTQVDLILPDGQASPVNHTFVSSGVDGKGVATWLEKTSTLLAGFFRLTTSARLPSKPGDPVRYQMKLVIPTVAAETVNGVTYQKVIRSCLFDGTFVLPADSSLQERKDFVAYVGGNIAGTAPGKLGYQIINQDSVV